MVLGEDVLASSPLFFYSVYYKTIEKFSIKYLYYILKNFRKFAIISMYLPFGFEFVFSGVDI